MHKGKIKLLTGLCAAALLTACGTPGPPVVPSLQLPQPPSDVRAARKGSQVFLTWTPSAVTTDGQTIRPRYAGPSVICRSVGSAPAANCTRVGQAAEVVPVQPARGKRRGPGNQPVQYVDKLPAALMAANPAALAQYAVQAENSRGRAAGLSNQVAIALAPTPPPPTALTTEVTADGVWVRWCPAEMPKIAGLSYSAHVFRQEVDSKAGPAQVAGEPVATPGAGCERRMALLDQGFEWEKRYRYWVAGVTTVAGKATVEGDDSEPIALLPHDIYPPAVPMELEAVASGVGQKPFVDLAWRAGADADLAGYNVYRQEASGQWTKRNAALVTVPAFRDEPVAAGATYTYAVTAVDVRGNESQRSRPANEAVPQP